MMNWLNARMSANQGCNTAKGVLFAAPFFKYIMDGEVLLQYRERAEPFAAREWKYDSALSGTVAIPRKGRTLCGAEKMVRIANEIRRVAIPRKGRTLCGC